MTKYNIAKSMQSLMSDPSYQAVFSKPEINFNKTAAKKKEDPCKKCKENKCKCNEKAGKAKGKKNEKMNGKEKENGNKKKSKKASMQDFQACAVGLCRISEILDNNGFEKAATLALLTLDSFMKQAEDSSKSDEDMEEDCNYADDDSEVDIKGLLSKLRALKEDNSPESDLEIEFEENDFEDADDGSLGFLA